MDQINQKIQDKMIREGISQNRIDFFIDQVNEVKLGDDGFVNWDFIQKIDEDKIIPYNLISSSHQKSNLEKFSIIKLNGGLGTSMGLDLPKSFIPIKENLSFLEIIIKQVEFIRKKSISLIPLIFMNSFKTEQRTLNKLKEMKFENGDIPYSFLQGKIPRLETDTLFPIDCKNPEDDWCPPGHGDIWISMIESGILDSLLENGKEIAFISNSDNLGATVDLNILNYFIESNLDFLAEITPKTNSDKKGGVFYQYKNYLKLLEIGQVPKSNLKEFMNLDIFPYFNTNNLWVNLKKIKEKYTNHHFHLNLILNPKTIENKKVLQLETAIASAIQNFKSSKCIVVKRDRFSPVKRCEDYLARISDVMILTEEFLLLENPNRKKLHLKEIQIELDDQFYQDLNNFNNLFPKIPSLQFAKLFKVEGEVIFDVPIIIQGSVQIINQTGAIQKISSLKRSEFKEEIVYLT